MKIQEREIIEVALTELRRTTGLIGRVLRGTATGGQAPDALLEIEADHHKYRFAAEVKVVDRFRTPAVVKAHLSDLRDPPILVAPYITRETAEMCRNIHLPFIDTAGNVFLEGQRLLIYVVGQRPPTVPRHNQFRALKPAGLKITFTLLCRPELVHSTYREIAAAAGVALGTVGPVIKDLEARGFLRLGAQGRRKVLDPKRLLEEWTTHYPTKLRPNLNPRRFRAEAERLQRADLKHQDAYWGGEMAAQKLTQFLKPAAFTIYTRGEIARLVAVNRMRADPDGNVEVLDVFWGFDPDRGYPDLVPPVLVYADLVATNDGRNLEAARLIYEQRIAPTRGIS